MELTHLRGRHFLLLGVAVGLMIIALQGGSFMHEIRRFMETAQHERLQTESYKNEAVYKQQRVLTENNNGNNVKNDENDAEVNTNGIDVKSIENDDSSSADIYLYELTGLDIKEGASIAEIERIFLKYADQVEVYCTNSGRFGHQKDGGWDICLANNYTLKKPCLIYSFGINNDWSFDDAVAKEYGCTVRAFDPSMNKPNHTHGDTYPVQFYTLGLGGEDGKHQKWNWTMRKFSTLFSRLDPPVNGHQKLVDFMKFDIEGSEFDVIKAMDRDDVFKYVKQIGFEVHNLSDHAIERTFELLNILRKHGFLKWKAHVNMVAFRKSDRQQRMWRSCCYEFYFINSRYLDKYSAKYLNVPAPFGYNAVN